MSSPTEAVDGVAARLAAVRERLASACAAAGRSPDEVTLVAVSKRHPDAAVRAAYEAGQRDFGENLVQAWRGRVERLPDLPIRWHLIGGLQTNKARHVARGRPHLLHTVDRARLVSALAARLDAPLDVLLEVNVDAEPRKAGCLPGEVEALADLVAAEPQLRLRGVMSIPRPPADGTAPRAAFATTRACLEQVRDRLEGPPVLSMGMSSDFEAAIAEGSTLVRIGTAIFGPRTT